MPQKDTLDRAAYTCMLVSYRRLSHQVSIFSVWCYSSVSISMCGTSMYSKVLVPPCTAEWRFLRRWTWTGDFKCREVKTGFYRNISFFWDSHWLEIWSNHFCPSMGLNGGSVATDSVHCISMEWNKNNHWKKPGFLLSYDLAPPAPPLQAGIGKAGLHYGEETG